MVKLELEITDKMMQKLQERAEAFSVEPSDVAKNILSCALVTKEKPSWLDNVSNIASQVGRIVVAVTHAEAESE